MCDQTVSSYGTPRQGADGPLTEDVMKCRLKPMRRDDYPVTSDAAGTWSGFFNSASHDPPGVYTIRFVAKQGGVITAVGMFTMTP